MAQVLSKTVNFAGNTGHIFSHSSLTAFDTERLSIGPNSVQVLGLCFRLLLKKTGSVFVGRLISLRE